MSDEQQLEPVSPAVAEPPAYKLYSTRQIGWSSFIGGPLAGTWMIRANFKRLGNVKASHVAAVIGAAAVAVVVVVGYVLERKFGKGGNLSLGVVLGIATQNLAKHYQGRAIAAHENDGGRIESVGKSLGVTVIGLLQTALGAVALLSYLETTVVIGGTHRITLEGMAEKADAERLGAVLTEFGVFRSGMDTYMALERGRSDWTVSFHVDKETLTSGDLAAIFAPIAKELSARLYGSGVHLAFPDEFGFARKRCEFDPRGEFVCR
jgi:hypothetical protein